MESRNHQQINSLTAECGSDAPLECERRPRYSNCPDSRMLLDSEARFDFHVKQPLKIYDAALALTGRSSRAIRSSGGIGSGKRCTRRRVGRIRVTSYQSAYQASQFA